MRRKPATSSQDKPPCFGKHPSIVFEGCSSCARRTGCFRAFSPPGVTVLTFANLRVNIAKAGDVRATDVLLHGLDSELWGVLSTVCAKYGLTLKAKATARPTRFRARARDKNGRTVLGIVRLDSRRILIDGLRIDYHAAAAVSGCTRRVKDGRKRPYYVLDLLPDGGSLSARLASKVDRLLALSYLAGTYVPGIAPDHESNR